MKIAVCSLLARTATADAICSLPFGEDEQSRLLSLQNPDRATQSLGALLALWQLCGASVYPIRRTPEGKPYFHAPHAPAFSLTHIKDVSVAALADRDEGNIGIDAEELRPYDRKGKIAARFFTEAEQAMLADTDTDEVFFKLWTAKEATVKMNGLTLATHLSNETESASYTRHFRITENGRAAILCLAAEKPITHIEWLVPPTITIQEI